MKLLIRCIHKFHKRTEKKAAELSPLYTQLLAKLSRVQFKVEEVPDLRDTRKRQGLASNYV